MTTHELKTIAPYFQDILDGYKTFELRRDDRRFEPGDVLWLREWNEQQKFTGREMHRRITYVMRADGEVLPPSITGLVEGHVILGLSTTGRSWDARH